jgi:phosphoglycerate dehydrogenase-like enzyme
MRVIGVDARREDLPEGVGELHQPDALRKILPQGDFVIMAVLPTPDTEGMVGSEQFNLMRSTVYLINIGRGKTSLRTSRRFFTVARSPVLVRTSTTTVSGSTKCGR